MLAVASDSQLSYLDGGTIAEIPRRTGLQPDPIGRLTKIRNGLAPQEWTKVGAMALTVLVLNVLGWGLLAAASGRYHVSKV